MGRLVFTVGIQRLKLWHKLWFVEVQSYSHKLDYSYNFIDPKNFGLVMGRFLGFTFIMVSLEPRPPLVTCVLYRATDAIRIGISIGMLRP